MHYTSQGGGMDDERRMTAWLLEPDGRRVAMTCEWTYNRLDPWAVHVTFTVDPPVKWTFARALLVDGLAAGTPAGLGDVQVWKDPPSGTFRLQVRSPHGAALFAMSAVAVGRFLHWTFLQCPLSQEADSTAGSVEAELRRMLEESP